MEEVLNGYVTNPNPTLTQTPNLNPNPITELITKIQKERLQKIDRAVCRMENSANPKNVFRLMDFTSDCIFSTSFFQSLNGCAQEQTLEHLNKAMIDVLVNITTIHENTEKVNSDLTYPVYFARLSFFS